MSLPRFSQEICAHVLAGPISRSPDHAAGAAAAGYPFAGRGNDAIVELPPGDPGTPPHRHSGPVFGYMPDGDVIHYQAANHLSDACSRFVVVMVGVPGEPMGCYKRVFVAGSTGVLGRRIIPLLTGQGHEVTALTRRPGRAGLLSSLGARPAVADALDPASLAAAVKEAAPDVIMHQLTDLTAGHSAANAALRTRGWRRASRRKHAARPRRAGAQADNRARSRRARAGDPAGCRMGRAPLRPALRTGHLVRAAGQQGGRRPRRSPCRR